MMTNYGKCPVLRISVPVDDHSHLIGKKGLAHKLLQATTKTLVHFPDLNAHHFSKKFILQAEHEVVLMPADAKLKSEPWTSEGELVKQFEACREKIRKNQLLIYRLFASSSTMDNERILKLCSIAGQAHNEDVQVSSQKIAGHILVVVRGVMDQSASIVRVVAKLQALLSCSVYNTMRLPSSHWQELLAMAGSRVIKEFDLPEAAPEAALLCFLNTVGVLLQFHKDDLISVSGRDAASVLDVKQRLIQALPVSLILTSPPHECLSQNVEDVQVVASLLKLYGVRVDSYGGVGQRIILETHEANFAALFEARWLLSHSCPRGLLTRWTRMRHIWPVNCDLPACLRSPRAFAEVDVESDDSVPALGPLSPPPTDSTAISGLSQYFSAGCQIEGPAADGVASEASKSAISVVFGAHHEQHSSWGSFSDDSGLGKSAHSGIGCSSDPMD